MQKQYGIDSMPETAENVAEQFALSGLPNDAFALRSQQRAAGGGRRRLLPREDYVRSPFPSARVTPCRFIQRRHPLRHTLEAAGWKLATPFRDQTARLTRRQRFWRERMGACALVLAPRRRRAFRV